MTDAHYQLAAMTVGEMRIWLESQGVKVCGHRHAFFIYIFLKLKLGHVAHQQAKAKDTKEKLLEAVGAKIAVLGWTMA